MGSYSHRHGVIFTPTWGHVHPNMGPYSHRHGVMFTPTWGHIHTDMRSCLPQHGAMFTPTWGHVHTNMGPCSHRHWIMFTPTWGHVHTDMGSYLPRHGVASMILKFDRARGAHRQSQQASLSSEDRFAQLKNLDRGNIEQTLRTPG